MSTKDGVVDMREQVIKALAAAGAPDQLCQVTGNFIFLSFFVSLIESSFKTCYLWVSVVQW